MKYSLSLLSAALLAASAALPANANNIVPGSAQERPIVFKAEP